MLVCYFTSGSWLPDLPSALQAEPSTITATLRRVCYFCDRIYFLALCDILPYLKIGASRFYRKNLPLLVLVFPSTGINSPQSVGILFFLCLIFLGFIIIKVLNIFLNPLFNTFTAALSSLSIVTPHLMQWYSLSQEVAIHYHILGSGY